MGKPRSEQLSDQAPNIIHFSHPHPLHLIDNLQTLPPNFSCSACKLNDAVGSIYACKPCNFTIHTKCYQLPQQLKHPFDPNHDLILQPKPVYPEGLFNCDACGNHGSGFSYNCRPCGVDLHTTCATLPAQFAHGCHHHQLGLQFSAPYAGNAFSCDVCKGDGSRTWIYRCDVCEFDAHLTCVARLVPDPSGIQGHQRSVVYPPQHSNLVNPPCVGGYGGSHMPHPVVIGQPQGQFPAKPYLDNNFNQPIYGAGTRPVNGGDLRDQLLVGAANGLASGFAQATTEAVIQGIFGGGGGGGVGLGDVVWMGVGGQINDGDSYADCGYGGTDGGYQ